MNGGKVYLIGAGPGDPGLLTIRGRECIEGADVVVHDDLVDGRLLRFARPQAEIVPMGKRGGASFRDHQQAAINERMIREASAGRVVARLKGGDPFVFGRGGEEAEALAAAGIPFEVVPGVSSAIGVPAFAGIPVTHRGLNSSFTVVTGHEAPSVECHLDWAALARMETLVFLMGLRTLREITRRLLAEGKNPQTPAACIRSGTRPDQQVIIGTLADLADQVERAEWKPPAVVVVGDTVRLRDRLAWFEKRPLFGRRIVVTRARERAGSFVERLERAGAEALECPTIEIEETANPGGLDETLRQLAGFDWIIFTSQQGVATFFERMIGKGGDLRDLGAARLAAIGPATAKALREKGLRVALTPQEFRAEELIAALAPQVRGKRILLPRATGAREILPAALREAGGEVVEIETYRAVRPRSLPERVRRALTERSVDAVTFTSSSTVRHFVELVRAAGLDGMGGSRVACIGPVTSQTARELGLEVDIEAQVYTTEGLLRALVDYFSPQI
jgi:uroporphyrinogen III methyltransferase/synthase